jgi:hypothetical protein
VRRSSSELAWIALERDWIDLPAEIVVPRKNAAFGVELDDLAAHGDALVFGAVSVGVVEERLGPCRPIGVAHRSRPLTHPMVPSRGRVARRLELLELLLRVSGAKTLFTPRDHQDLQAKPSADAPDG